MFRQLELFFTPHINASILNLLFLMYAGLRSLFPPQPCLQQRSSRPEFICLERY